jgi:hypothetical protein
MKIRGTVSGHWNLWYCVWPLGMSEEASRYCVWPQGLSEEPRGTVFGHERWVKKPCGAVTVFGHKCT